MKKVLFIMKRIKIMLTAIGVLAVVAAALAFEVKTVGSFAFCITSDLNSPTCNIKVSAATFDNIGTGSQLKYVLVPATSTCNPPVPCSQVAFIKL